MPSDKPYRGLNRGLVLAFDIGTTYSGISYSILDPGQIPKIDGVMRFPGQSGPSESSKIPTILYYDKYGVPCAYGADAVGPNVEAEAAENDWVKVEWFKLHMRPSAMDISEVEGMMSQLPQNKPIHAIVADFLRYLYKAAREYIENADIANGSAVWNTFGDRIKFVISHPNGWEGAQQSYMRNAAVLAGLIPDTDAGQSRLLFVTEGEASLHFAVHNRFTMNNEEGVLIIDAGGGTIDMSAYKQTTSSGITKYKEITVPECHFQGGILVKSRADKFLRRFLKDSLFLQDVDRMVEQFDGNAKLVFRDPSTPQYIPFGGRTSNAPQFNIRQGQLKLLGTDVASFFEPAIQCIVAAVQRQNRSLHGKFKHVILVGGFSANDYLCNRVTKQLQSLGLNVRRPSNHVNKAAADGAVSFYLNQYVDRRISKLTFGSSVDRPYNSNDPEHIKRASDVYTSLDGIKSVRGAFSVILPKNTQVSETQEFRRPFSFLCPLKDDFSSITSSVWCYRGNSKNPQWMDVDKSNYYKMCDIELDLGHLALDSPEFQQRGGPNGMYYKMQFELILLFGTVEFKALMAWKEAGIEKRSPAKVLYVVEPPTTRED